MTNWWVLLCRLHWCGWCPECSAASWRQIWSWSTHCRCQLLCQEGKQAQNSGVRPSIQFDAVIWQHEETQYLVKTWQDGNGATLTAGHGIDHEFVPASCFSLHCTEDFPSIHQLSQRPYFVHECIQQSGLDWSQKKWLTVLQSVLLTALSEVAYLAAIWKQFSQELIQLELFTHSS